MFTHYYCSKNLKNSEININFPTSRSTSCNLGAPYLILFAQSRFLNFDVIAKACPADRMELRDEVHPRDKRERQAELSRLSSPAQRTAGHDAISLALARFHGACST